MKRAGFRRAGESAGTGFALVGTSALHAAAVVVMLARPAGRQVMPPVYRVELVAAPAPDPGAKRAPEVLDRPSDPPPEAPAPKPEPKKAPVAPAPAPPPPAPSPANVKREPAPRNTPKAEPAPGVKPSTGSDPVTVKTGGVEFQYPEYLRNIVAAVYRRWQRPAGNVALKAEVLFFVHRDGSVSGIQFVRRSGNFAFDLEAQGAVEAAANAGAFGPLPEGYPSEVLPVNFFFDPESVR